MNHKSFALVCSLLLIAGSTFAQSWHWIYPQPQGFPLNDVCFPDSMEGWAVGDYGTMMHTTDGARTWELLPRGDSLNYRSIQFTDRDHGWLLSEYGSLFSTTNRGASWQLRMDTLSRVSSFSFIDNQVGFASSNGLYKTTNGGDHWQFVSYSIANKMQFVDSLNGWIEIDGWLNDNISIFKTTDGGVSWATEYNCDSLEFVDFEFTDSLHGWFVVSHNIYQSNSFLFRTVNGGESWDSTRFTGIIINSIKFYDSLTGVFGYDSINIDIPKLKVTTDGGVTWQDRIVSDSLYRFMQSHAVAMPTPNQICLVGDGAEILISSRDRGETWQHFNTVYPYGWIYSVDFVDRMNGWILGEKLTRTTDGGETWTQLMTIPSTRFGLDLHFLNAQYGWFSVDSLFYRTTNGGSSWSVATIPVIQSIYRSIDRFQFIDSMNGWANEFYTNCYLHTTDGGVTWREETTGSSFNIDFVAFFNQQIGVATNNRGYIARTTDGGLHWQSQVIDTTDWRMGQVCFVDSANWIIPIDDRDHFRTIDGGLHWTREQFAGEINNTSDIIKLKIVDPQNYWLIGYHEIFHSTDAGAHWTNVIPIMQSNFLWSVDIVDNQMAWVLASPRSILRFSEHGLGTWEATPISLPQEFALNRIYPNPFNATTTISFTLPHPDRVQLTVHDLLGRKVATVLREALPAGTHHVNFDGTNLSSGTYFVRLQAGSGSFTKTQKMVLLK